MFLLSVRTSRDGLTSLFGIGRSRPSLPLRPASPSSSRLRTDRECVHYTAAQSRLRRPQQWPCKQHPQQRNALVNTACFPIPPAGYFGNSGPTVLTGPGVNNWDVSLQKSLKWVTRRRGSSYERTCSMRGTTRNSIDQMATPEQEQASGGSRRHCLRALSRSA